MKIQLGSIVLNKTNKYLMPCLKAYGNDFAFRFHSIWKVAVGVGDVVTVKSNIILEKHIFLLLDTTAYRSAYNLFMAWIVNQSMYEDDYAFDNILNGKLHMLVLKIPEQHYNAIENLRKSEFSKMYSQVDLEEYFADKPQIKKVLIKDHSYKFEFSKQLETAFNVNLSVEEIDDKMELDLPFNEKDEVFNTEL